MEEFFFGKHLEDDETVSLIVHKYWGIATNSLFWPTVGFLAGWVALAVAPVRLMLIIVLTWSAAMAYWWLQRFFDYYLDVWLITDHGIIDLHWEGWFHRQSTRILYSDVQGVSHEIKGIVGTLTRCGTITVEKVSTGGTISLANVRNPRVVESKILKNMEAYLHKTNLKNAKHVQELLSKFVAENMQQSSLPEDAKKKEEPKRKGIISRRV